MSLHCKVAISPYREGSAGAVGKAALGDLQHEGRRLARGSQSALDVRTPAQVGAGAASGIGAPQA